MSESVQRVELGCPGHFTCASDCRFRRHTQVGTAYRVSTVGDLFFKGKDGRQTIGAAPDSFFETLVFRTTDRLVADSEECGCREVESWSEIDGERYATAGDAQRGHERYVATYLALAEREATAHV